MNTMYLIIFYIFGAIFSSFLCVVGMRLPRKMNFIKGKSKCDNCDHELKFYELVPIISYLFLGGRCKRCKQKISILIPISEILGGLLFSLSFYRFGFSIELVFAVLVSSLFILVLVSDVNYFIIPDEIIITYTVFFLVLQFANGGVKNLLYHLCVAVFLFFVMYLTMLLGEVLFKKESLGGGDVKLLFLFGLVLDPLGGVLTIFLGSMIALPISLIVLIKNKTNMIPFGPFLLLAFYIIYFIHFTPTDFINLLT